jgi:long-chain acyl-CoA synthetase
MSEANRKKNLKINSWLKNVFEKNWDETLVYDPLNSRQLSYGEFLSSASECGDALKKLGLHASDIVAVMLPNSLDLMVLYFGAMLKGIIIAPIDPLRTDSDIKGILSQVNYKMVVSDGSHGYFRDKQWRKIGELSSAFYKKKELNYKQGVRIFRKTDFQRPFLITFTSGSTGVPKGVMHSGANLCSSALAFRGRFNFGSKNVFYHNLPMTYMAGILNLFFLPVVSGSKIVIGERFSMETALRFWDIPIRFGVNTFWFVPTVISLLLRIDRGNKGVEYCRRVKIIGCVGTAPLSKKVRNEFETKYAVSLYESYGLSETLFVSTQSPRAKGPEGCVGKILSGVSLDFKPDGEIVIGVPWMFGGYANVSSVENFENGKFISGDLGELRKEGLLFITGRKKDLIIRGGINISPRRLEEFIDALSLMEEEVVMGFPDDILGEKIVCFYVAKDVEFGAGQKQALNARIMQNLGAPYRIDKFVEFSELPRTSSGKIDKPKLRKVYST